MNKKLLISTVLSFALSILTITGASNNNNWQGEKNVPYILKNNSSWDIGYKLQGQPDSEVKDRNQYIKAGDFQRINNTKPIQIRRSGTGSTFTTSWDTIPKPYDVARATLGHEAFHQFDLAVRRGGTPWILIGSGWTGGWSFTVEVK